MNLQGTLGIKGRSLIEKKGIDLLVPSFITRTSNYIGVTDIDALDLAKNYSF
jgi:hypothetical protein